MSNAGGLKNLIRREVKSRAQTIIGTVVTQRVLTQFDQTTTGSPIWACSVDIGTARLLENVPIRGYGKDGLTYADIGRSVQLRRNTQGRFEVVGPGDHVVGAMVRKQYAPDGTEASSQNEGFGSEIVPFEYYEGPTSGVPGTSRWNDGSTPFPFTRLIDADGNPV